MNQELQIPPEVLTEAAAARQMLVAAQSYPVPASPQQYADAGAEVKAITGRKNRLKEMHAKLKAPILAAGRAIDDFFREPLQYCDDGIKAIKSSMTVYDEQIERQRREAERLAAEAARREQDRLRAEAAKAEQAAREKREAEEAKARAAREKEEAKARALEEAGRAEQAAARRAAAEEAERQRMQDAADKEAARMREAESKRMAADTMPTAPVIAMDAPKVAGISTREEWSGEVTDIKALIGAVAVGMAPIELIEVSQPTLNKLARALKGGLNYPGVRAVVKTTKAVRA